MMISQTALLRLLFLCFYCCSLLSSLVLCFSPAWREVKQQNRWSTSFSSWTTTFLSNNNDESIEGQSTEASQMYGYIQNFLKKTNQDQQDSDCDTTMIPTQVLDASSTAYYTHLIALPMESCHELMIELESVQRAILYHCPVLIHACLTPAITRLPLLYVQAEKGATTTSSSPNDVDMTRRLSQVVQDVVHKFLFASDQHVDELTARDDFGNRPDWLGSNQDGIQPLFVPFETLEVDGINNQVLLTVAQATAPGTRRLQQLVQILQRTIQEKMGWKTFLPEDPQQDLDSTNRQVFRPRIPFMRLPDNWNECLGISDDDDDLLPSDQGGNGISPIFWGHWMNDAFGDATRLTDIAIYPRGSLPRGDGRLDEQAFAWPDCSFSLPLGNAVQAQKEKRFEDYQQERMEQAKELQTKEVRQNSDDEENLLFAEQKEHLEDLYYRELPGMPRFDESSAPEARIDKEDITTMNDLEPNDLLQSSIESTIATDTVDDWTRERIRKTVDARAKIKSDRELSIPKNKPSIESNPVFAKYKEGTLVPESEKPPPKRELPPFPSREHCVGFWTVIQSPTGFEVEEGDISRSENLVLRVDGTTAGGPILDQETRQKASAGNWKLTGTSVDDAHLRIRLVIPPKKDRIIVMKGFLKLVSMASDLPLAKATFGIPELEKRAERADSEQDDLLYCSGNVYIEDAVTGENRKDIGQFSIMKLQTPSDPSQFSITIPRSVRNQD